MVKYLLALAFILCAGVAQAGVSFQGMEASPQPHVYYISQTGNDRNSGLDAADPWLTFTFASAHMVGNSKLIMACGDWPTTGASGTLNSFHNIASVNLGDRGWIVISGDTTCGGGVYPSISATSAASPISPTTQSNFVEYNHLSLNCTFQSNCNCAGDTFVNNHLRFTDLQVGPCHGGGITVSGGEDYIYISHVIAHDTSDTSTFHGSGISVGFLVASDTLPGYHNYILDVISYNNQETWVGTHTDGNGIIIDDTYGDQQSKPEYMQQTLIDGAIVFNNGARGLEIFDSSFVTARHIVSYNNGLDSQLTNVSFGCGSSVFPSINVERAHDNYISASTCQEVVATVPGIKLGGQKNFAQSSIGFNVDGTLNTVTAGQTPPNQLGTLIQRVDPQYTTPGSPGTTFASIKAAFTLQGGSPGLGAGTEYGFTGVPANWNGSVWTENPSQSSSNMGQR